MLGVTPLRPWFFRRDSPEWGSPRSLRFLHRGPQSEYLRTGRDEAPYERGGWEDPSVDGFSDGIRNPKEGVATGSIPAGGPEGPRTPDRRVGPGQMSLTEQIIWMIANGQP
jgi:hypothetical protein